jgi:iron(III) transport system permease protein
LRTTIIFAVATTIGAVIAGVLLAVFLTRTDLPGRNLLVNFITIPYYVSPLVLAFAWAVIYGPQGFGTILARNLGLPTWNLYTVGGITLVAIMYYTPYTFLYTSSSLALSDPQLESAARVGGANPFQTLIRVTIPLVRPAITFSILLTLVSSLELLSIPLVLGTPRGIQVLSTFLYKLGIVGVRNDYGAIAVVSLFVVLMVTGLVVLQGKLVSQERRFVTVGGKATRPKLLQLGGWRWVIMSIVVAYIVLAILLPLAGIILQSFTSFLSPFVNPLSVLTSDNYQTVLGIPAYRKSITNSVLIATFGGAIGILFMTLSAITAYRSLFRGRHIVKYLAMIPRAFPGLIIGIGFLWAFLLVPGLASVRNTIWALTIAFIMRYLPIGFSAVSPSVLQVSDELDRASRVSGATWLGTIRHILIPILKPALLSGYILLYISFLKEYSTALFLFARGSQVIGTTMIELWRQGNSGPVASLASVQLAITAVVILLSRRALGVSLHE